MNQATTDGDGRAISIKEGRMRLRRILPFVVVAVSGVAFAAVFTLAARHGPFAMLIRDAVCKGQNTSCNGTVVNAVSSTLTSVQGQIQGFAIAAAPIALAAGGVAWQSGHRRAVGMVGAALGGLVLAVAASPIVN
jgi:hypothetical protein